MRWHLRASERVIRMIGEGRYRPNAGAARGTERLRGLA
jgi:hypothetical protein